MKVNKWVTVTDAAGRQVTVRRVDAREIEAAAKGVVAAPVEVVATPDIEVDDQSVAPKVSRRGRKK